MKKKHLLLFAYLDIGKAGRLMLTRLNREICALIALLLLLLAGESYGQNIRFQGNVRGGFTLTGNTLLNNSTSSFLNTAGGNTKSSSADLVLPAGSTIEKAYLYVEGYTATKMTSVRFRVPGGAYITYNTSSAGFLGNPGSSFQQFMVDVTNVVPPTGYISTIVPGGSPSGNGRYAVADPDPTGFNYGYGWALFVVYTNPASRFRSVTIADNNATFGFLSAPVVVNINNVSVPASGTVNAVIGITGSYGDEGFLDGATFGPASGTATALTDPYTGVTSDILNSSIAFAPNNNVSADGGPAINGSFTGRTPAQFINPNNSSNTNWSSYFYDADILNAAGMLPNSSTPINIRLTQTSGGIDALGSGSYAVAVDIAAAVLTKSVAPMTIAPGGLATYTFTITNTQPGAINLTNLSFTDNLPSGLRIANPANAVLTGGSNGTVTATAGGSSISLAGLSLAAGQTATITVSITNVPGQTNPSCSANPAAFTNGFSNITNTSSNLANGVTDQCLIVTQITPPPQTDTVTYCQNALAVPLIATGTNLLWYTAATGGTGNASAPTPLTTSPGTTIWYVSQTLSGLESPRSPLVVIVHPTPVVPGVSSPVTYCQGVAATALTATGTNLLWYTAQTGGIGSATAPIPSTTTPGSTIYYVSQTVSGCESGRTPVVVMVTSPQTPTFTQVGPYCSGASIPALPTTSGNGVTGSWSPAINNTATTTYTFTPSAGQCANTTTMSIVITPNVIPTFTQAGPYCTGATIPALPTTSGNGVTGSWSPAINNTATTTYTFTPSAGQCATTTTMEIVINNNITPLFTQAGPYCTGATIPALPTTSNNGITGSWSPALNNSTTTTYTFTPSAGQCATSTTMQIVIDNNITPMFTQAGPYCSGATIPALPTASNNGITGSWSPAINNTATTTYTFTPSAGQCANTTTMSIVITPNVTPTFTQVGPYCSGAAIPALPTTSGNGVTGSWSPAINNTATTTYTFTPAAGQCANTTTMSIVITPNVTPTFTQAGPYCAGATIPALPTTSGNGITGSWSPAINNTATTTYTFTPLAGQCANIATMSIAISPNVTPTFTQAGPYCSGATIPVLPTTSNNGITGSWSPALNNTATTTYTFTPAAGQCATSTTMQIVIDNNLTPLFTQAGPYCAGATIPALPATSNNGITGSWSPAINNTATTTYTFTPSAGQCATSTTMQIVIDNNITPVFTQAGPYCAGAAIPALPTTANNGITGSWSPAINNTATTTYTFTPSSGQCAISTTMTIVVNPIVTPVFTQAGPYCAGTAIPALATTSNNGITGSWTPAINNTATTTYTFTPAAGQCANMATMTIIINPPVTPIFTQVAPICSGGTLNALPTTANNGVTGSWSPALNSTATTTYTFTPSAGQCATTATMTIVVNPNVTPLFTQVAPVCPGITIPALPTTSNNGITGTWSPALNNTATTTYTFTPNAGQTCVLPASMQITVLPYLTGQKNVRICEGDAYTFNGVSYTASVSGISDTIANAGACDSIITLNLIVVPVNPVLVRDTVQGCGSVVYNGQQYSVSTQLSDTLTTVLGCDSIYKSVTLIVYPEYHDTLKADVFGCDSVVYNQQRYYASTRLTEVFQTIHGCDSLVKIVDIEIYHFELSASMSPEAPYANDPITIETDGNAGYDILSWTPPNLFPDQTAKTQRISLTGPEQIIITGSSRGCVDTAIINIGKLPVYSTDVDMPNAFSPNGDGLNDVFRPVFKLEKDYKIEKFHVYNRYGEIVYATANLNGGWDGYYKGRLQDQGVYYYYVKIKFRDDSEKTFKGDVTLIR